MATTEDQQRYMVIMDGSIMLGAERVLVIKKLSRLFGTNAKNVEAMLNGEPLIIKKNLSAQRAHQYFRTITNAGAACHLVEFGTTDVADYRPVDRTATTSSAPASDLSIKFSEDSAADNDIRRRVADRIRQLEDTGQFQLEDLESRQHNDKIIFLALIILIFSMLAAVYIII